MAQYQGNEVGYDFVWTLEDCQKLCEENKKCNSITYGTYGDGYGSCSQRDKCFTGFESKENHERNELFPSSKRWHS